MDSKATVSPKSGLHAHFIKGAIGSLLIQIGFAGCAFLNAIMLSRALGAEGYGAFANAMAWVNLLTIPATLGFGVLLVRETAIYRLQKKWGLLKGLLRFSDCLVLIFSVVLALISAMVAERIFSSPDQAVLLHTIWVALFLLPVFALHNLKEGVTRGLEYVIRACFSRMIVRPGLLLVGIGAMYLFWAEQLSAPVAMGINVGAGAVALGVGAFFYRSLLPGEVKYAQREYTPRPWLKAAFYMLGYGGAQVLLGQTDIVMLGAMRGAKEVGLYVAASRLSFLLLYIIYACEMILAPIISRLYTNNEKSRMQKIITSTVRWSLLATFPFGVLLIVKGDSILIIFGNEFLAAQMALVILACGRLLDVALGSAALILSFVNCERIVAIVFATGALGNIALNALLIPCYGMDGAALATIVSLVLVKLLLSFYAKKKLGVGTTILGA